MGKTRQRAGPKTHRRKTLRHSPDPTRTTSQPPQRPTTSPPHHQQQCNCYQWNAHKAERSSKLFFFSSSPKNKTRPPKEKDNEKSPAQQGSTQKRSIKIILTVSKAQGFFLSKKREQAIIIYPNKQTKQRTEDKDKHALTLNKNALTTLTHNSPHKLKI